MEATPTVTVAQLFAKFTAGKKEMDGKTFMKFNKDCKLLVKNKVTSTDIDIIFAKVKAKGTRKIDVAQFKQALELVAAKRKQTLEEVVAKAGGAGGPKFKGTKADFVKFHDDKTTYTGVYAKGGPTNVDTKGGQISDLNQLCDRTKANVIGVKK